MSYNCNNKVCMIHRLFAMGEKEFYALCNWKRQNIIFCNLTLL